MNISLEVPQNIKTLVVKQKGTGTEFKHSSVYHRKSKTHLIIVGESGGVTQYSREHYRLG